MKVSCFHFAIQASALLWITRSCAFQNVKPPLSRHIEPTSYLTRRQWIQMDAASRIQIVEKEDVHLGTGPALPSRCRARRSFLVAGGGWVATTLMSNTNTNTAAFAAVDVSNDLSSTDTFASIAERANQISKEVDRSTMVTASKMRATDKTFYDFSLPVQGTPVPLGDLIRQEFGQESLKVKAILVVNIKQDDPIARKMIPELITLAAKYGRNDTGLVVIACPTDQGYYEPDTSQLVRLKLASEYGYGINPSTFVVDKVNLLGKGAHPFWRWLESTCRTPAGLGRIEGNFEKFLLDGRTGLPVRRYPRKYAPLNISDDIAALIAGRALPPPRANYMEEWRLATVEAQRDTYRFEKGLNYFD